MRKLFSSLLVIVLSLALMVSLTGCKVGNNKDIKNLLAEFESSCNSLDFDAVLDCINPQISDKVNLALGLVGMFTDTDKDELFEKLAGFLSKDDIKGAEFFSSIKIEVKDIAVEDKDATVSTIITYNINGDETTRESTFYCSYYIDEWYINAFTIE